MHHILPEQLCLHLMLRKSHYANLQQHHIPFHHSCGHQRLRVAGVHSRCWHLTAAMNNGNGSTCLAAIQWRRLMVVMYNRDSEQGPLIMATVFDGVQWQRWGDRSKDGIQQRWQRVVTAGVDVWQWQWRMAKAGAVDNEDSVWWQQPWMMARWQQKTAGIELKLWWVAVAAVDMADNNWMTMTTTW